MNLLERFNSYYLSENSEIHTYAPSLLEFFRSQVEKRLTKNSTSFYILDLGSGAKSLFEDLSEDLTRLCVKAEVTAIDFSEVAISKSRSGPLVRYEHIDITREIHFDNGFDLIFDSHCMHCILDKDDRSKAFKNIYEGLASNGLFCAEMMIAPVGKESEMPYKYVADFRKLEAEVLSHGFKIIYFTVVRDYAFYNANGECDLVRLIAKK